MKAKISKSTNLVRETSIYYGKYKSSIKKAGQIHLALNSSKDWYWWERKSKDLTFELESPLLKSMSHLEINFTGKISMVV